MAKLAPLASFWPKCVKGKKKKNKKKQKKNKKKVWKPCQFLFDAVIKAGNRRAQGCHEKDMSSRVRFPMIRNVREWLSREYIYIYLCPIS